MCPLFLIRNIHLQNCHFCMGMGRMPCKQCAGAGNVSQKTCNSIVLRWFFGHEEILTRTLTCSLFFFLPFSFPFQKVCWVCHGSGNNHGDERQCHHCNGRGREKWICKYALFYKCAIIPTIAVWHVSYIWVHLSKLSTRVWPLTFDLLSNAMLLCCSCNPCHGQGSTQCSTCHGRRQLLVNINLTVKWCFI